MTKMTELKVGAWIVTLFENSPAGILYKVEFYDSSIVCLSTYVKTDTGIEKIIKPRVFVNKIRPATEDELKNWFKNNWLQEINQFESAREEFEQLKAKHLGIPYNEFKKRTDEFEQQTGNRYGQYGHFKLEWKEWLLPRQKADDEVPDLTCTCPSGDGSLQWPCPVHPPEKTLMQYCQECADEVAKWPAHMKVNISGYVPSPDSEVPTAKTYRIRSIKDLFLIPAERLEDALKEIGLGIAGFKAFSTGSDQPSQVLEYVDWTDDGLADLNFKILPGGYDYPNLLEGGMDNKALFVQMMPQIVHESQKGYDFGQIFDYLTAKPEFAGEGWLLAAKAMDFGLRHQQSYINELVAENTNLIKANIDVAAINADYLFEKIDFENKYNDLLQHELNSARQFNDQRETVADLRYQKKELEAQIEKLRSENTRLIIDAAKHALSTFSPAPKTCWINPFTKSQLDQWALSFVHAIFILAVVWSFVELLTS